MFLFSQNSQNMGMTTVSYEIQSTIDIKGRKKLKVFQLLKISLDDSYVWSLSSSASSISTGYASLMSSSTSSVFAKLLGLLVKELLYDWSMNSQVIDISVLISEVHSLIRLSKNALWFFLRICSFLFSSSPLYKSRRISCAIFPSCAKRRAEAFVLPSFRSI